MATDVSHDRRVNVRAPNPPRVRMNNRPIGDNGNVGSSASDIHHSGSVGVVYSDTGAKRRRQAFFDH